MSLELQDLQLREIHLSSDCVGSSRLSIRGHTTVIQGAEAYFLDHFTQRESHLLLKITET